MAAATSCRKRTRAAFMSPPAVVRLGNIHDVVIPPTDDEEEEEEKEEVERCVRPKFDLTPALPPTLYPPAAAVPPLIRVEVPHVLSLALPVSDVRKADGSIHVVFTVSGRGNLYSVSIDT